MELAAEQQIGNYRLIGRLGEGGMGEVWRAEDLKLRRTVAIKMLSTSVAQTAESQARLLREARTAAQLSHPNIATIHSIEEHGDDSFIVMEYIEGESLGDRLEQGPLPEAEVIWIARQVASALKEAHARGIIHRDIKPDNLMRTGDRLKVLDFGIAKRISPEQNLNSFKDYATAEGVVLGTLFYMSPEQALGKELDARTDIYSLGVVLYQLLSDSLPFYGDTATDTITRIIRDEAPPLRMLRPSVSSSLENLIERCMQKNRDYRYADAGELIAALDRLTVTTRTAPADVTAIMDRSRMPAPAMSAVTKANQAEASRGGNQRLLWAGAVAAVLILVAGVAFLTRGTSGGGSAQASTVEGSMIPVTAASETVSPTPAPASSPAPDIPASVMSELASESPVQESPSPEPAAQISEGAPAAATAQTEITVEEATTEAEAFYREGVAMMLKNRPGVALAAFRSALEQDASYAPARLKIAQMLLPANRAESSRQFRRTLQDRENLDARQIALAEIGAALAEGNIAQARSLGGQFAARYPNDPDLRFFQREGEKLIGERGRPQRRRN